MYIKKAGTFILVASMLIWFISSYPKNSLIEETYATKIEALQASVEAEPKKRPHRLIPMKQWKLQVLKSRLQQLLENEKNEKLMETTYLGMLGKTIEPISLRLLGLIGR